MARTRPVTLYRLNHRQGIYVVEGAEILFPRFVCSRDAKLDTQQDFLKVIDQALDGTNT